MIRGGDCPKFYEPLYFLPKEYVDEIGMRIDTVRKRRPKSRRPKVPDEAVDDCEKSYEAARGTNVKTSMEKHDDAGIMALVCRHDIPLFMVNIDTPGEQQKYTVALIEHFFTLLPPNATVAVLYDVACVLDRSLHLVRTPFFDEADILPFPSTTFCLTASREDLLWRPVPCTLTGINGLVSYSTIHASSVDLA